MKARDALLSMAILLAVSGARAGTTPDRPASIVVYPYVTVDLAAGINTRIQLTNTSNAPVDARCFYERLVTNCIGGEKGESCLPPEITCTGECLTEPLRVEFSLRLTAQQPVAWEASGGLPVFPLDGVTRAGPGGQNNGTSQVPELGQGPVTVTLRCVAVNEDQEPTAADVLVGQATINTQRGFPDLEADAAQYRAIGIRAAGDGPNDGTLLRLGGPDAEYEGCSTLHLLEHFFDHAPLTTGDRTAVLETMLVLTSCASIPGTTSDSIAQFFIHNEFGQRFSFSHPVRGELVVPLSAIDTDQPARSLFAVEVAGTLVGRTQIGTIGGGIHALAIETHRDRDSGVAHSDAVEVHATGERVDADFINLNASLCSGDCNRDGTVVVSEVVTGVGIGMGRVPLERCRPIDVNRDATVQITEMVESVASSLEGCPESEPIPSPSPTPTPIPTRPREGADPEITHFGLASADDVPLEPDETDEQGRLVFVRPFGQGFTLILEGRSGTTRRPVDGNTFSAGGLPPALQILASNQLGDGDPTVCEDDGRRGGIPAVPDLEFALDDQSTVEAMNDLGCRAYDRMASTARPCTRSPLANGRSDSPFALVARESEIQFCIPIAKAWALANGETVFAARVRDVEMRYSDVMEIVVRVGEQ